MTCLIRWRTIVAAGLALGGLAAGMAGAGCASSTSTSQSGSGGSGSGGEEMGCAMASGCDDNNPCTDDSCQQEQCAHFPLNEAPPGGLTDETPGDCYAPACEAGEVVQELMPGASCEMAGGQPGVCGSEGACGCEAPDGAADRYVDAALGADEPDRGGAPGACAYKTISYALTQGVRVIQVAPGTYDEANGEVFPITLDTLHEVHCQEVDGARPLITGSGPHLIDNTAVMVMGAETKLTGCDIAGIGQPTRCVELAAGGAPDNHALLQNNRISGCLGGTRAGNFSDITGNHFASLGQGSNVAAVFVQSDLFVWIDDNTFANNANDIRCNNAFPNVTGSGNSGPNGSAPSCQVCQGCPFQ